MSSPTPTYPGRWLSPSELERLDRVATRTGSPRTVRTRPTVNESTVGGEETGPPTETPRTASPGPVRPEGGPDSPSQTDTAGGQRRLFGGTLWDVTRDGDARVLRLYERHYSAHEYADGRARRLCIGPGEKMALVTPDGRAAFAWRLFHSDRPEDNEADGKGLNCSFFRNEGGALSSSLIRDAERHAYARWGARLAYTYVDAAATAARRGRRSEPGRCFLAAGWLRDGRTAGGLVVLRKRLTPQTDTADADRPTLPRATQAPRIRAFSDGQGEGSVSRSPLNGDPTTAHLRA